MTAREQFDDAGMERLQLRLAVLEKRLAIIPFADGSLVENQAIGTTPTTVEHRLGRAPRGVLVLSATPASALGVSATPSNAPSVLINLEASSAATFKLWFW